jgi:hypothetical protein
MTLAESVKGVGHRLGHGIELEADYIAADNVDSLAK